MRNSQEPSAEDLFDNMVHYVDEFIITLHKKDPSAIKMMQNSADELQDKLEALTEEIANSEEWTQDKLIELAAVSLLLSASMGVPDVEDGDDDEESEDDNEETTEDENDD